MVIERLLNLSPVDHADVGRLNAVVRLLLHVELHDVPVTQVAARDARCRDVVLVSGALVNDEAITIGVPELQAASEVCPHDVWRCGRIGAGLDEPDVASLGLLFPTDLDQHKIERDASASDKAVGVLAPHEVADVQENVARTRFFATLDEREAAIVECRSEHPFRHGVRGYTTCGDEATVEGFCPALLTPR